MLFCTALVYAQVGIETTSPQGALDIPSPNSGVVVPRVALISKDSPNPIINPQSGLPIEGNNNLRKWHEYGQAREKCLLTVQLQP